MHLGARGDLAAAAAQAIAKAAVSQGLCDAAQLVRQHLGELLEDWLGLSTEEDEDLEGEERTLLGFPFAFAGGAKNARHFAQH